MKKKKRTPEKNMRKFNSVTWNEASKKTQNKKEWATFVRE